ncbi:hypothetical protein Btru_057651 [Bulinus truncatus]|nr:hypothetical protein Btru_057651 [Bulinus truncatus]
MYVKDLETLKYSELQKLAKSVGIKANQKIDKLIQALKNHYIENENNSGELSENQGVKISDDTSSSSSDKLTSSHQENSNSELQKVPVCAETSVGPSAVNTPQNVFVRKRRRTFELETPTLGANSTPNLDCPIQDNQEKPRAKRIRKNTFNKDSPTNDEHEVVPRTSGSPGTRAIIESLNANLTTPERKEMILSAIDKKVQKEKESQPSQIPRYITYLANKNQETQPPKSNTPGNKNWTKIHDKEFSKFDSIDVYLEKKQQRMENLTGSAKTKSATSLSQKKGPKILKPLTRAQRQNLYPTKSQSFNFSKTPTTDQKELKANGKSFVPTVTSVKNLSFNFLKSPASKRLSNENKEVTVKGKPFVPTETSVKNLSFNFLKSPTTKGPIIENNELSSAKKSKVLTTTPFKFTGNKTTLNCTTTSTKKCFDIKASLAKPLTWKPHTGKLEPLNNKIAVLASKRPSRVAMASKSRQVQAKDVQRVKQLDRRDNQKYIDMMKRRGLMN